MQLDNYSNQDNHVIESIHCILHHHEEGFEQLIHVCWNVLQTWKKIDRKEISISVANCMAWSRWTNEPSQIISYN